MENLAGITTLAGIDHVEGYLSMQTSKFIGRVL